MHGHRPQSVSQCAHRIRDTTVGAAVALMMGAVPALAGPSTSSLNIISSSTIGSGTLGTVTLTQDGADEVDVTVALAANTNFVDTGGPHNAFAFNLNLATAYTILVASPGGGIFTLGANNSTNTPYGSFVNVIDCPGCGPGASNANPGPLELQITDGSGISIANFVANSNGYYFSADVIGPNGGTGSIASNSAPVDPPSIPEPGSLTLFASGLLGLVAWRRQHSRANR